MWLLRNGRRIRADLYIDPCWTHEERWSLYNQYVKYVISGMSKESAESAAAKDLWKRKWSTIAYA